MNELLKHISVTYLESGEVETPSELQISKKWLGFEPATKKNIEDAERRLNINLPNDYKDFLMITNGFTAASLAEPSFMAVADIDYLSEIDPFLIEVWCSHEGIWDISEALKRSLVVGGKDEEQYFLLIPPLIETEAWRYWTFSSWAPGEQEFPDLESYFKSVLKSAEHAD